MLTAQAPRGGPRNGRVTMEGRSAISPLEVGAAADRRSLKVTRATACRRSRPQRWRAWRSGSKEVRPRAEDGGEKAWPEPTWSAESQPPRSVTWNCEPQRREGPLEDFEPWRTDVAPVSR